MSGCPDYALEETLDFQFATRDGTGLPTTFSGTPAFEIYEDNGLTQITGAETLTVDHDGVTGANNLRVVATAANGFESGKSYFCRVSAGTVDSISVVGETVQQFSIQREPSFTRIGAGGASLGDLGGMSTGMKTEVQAELVTYDAVIPADLSSDAEIAAAVRDVSNASPAAGSLGLDVATTETAAAAIQAKTDDLTFTTANQVDANSLTVGDKTGFSLASTGLDAIVSTATGMVEIAKAIWDRVLSGATHNLPTSAGRRLRTLQDFGVYEGGHVWLDTIGGTAGTVDFEDGTVNRPSLALADALTIMNSIGLPGLHLIPGTSITLIATINQKEIVGEGYTVALGGQDVDNMHFTNAIVSGIGTAANAMHFRKCNVNTASVQNAEFTNSTFNGTETLTMTLAGNYNYIDCQSGVAGPGSPTFTKTAGQAITAQWRRWAGSVTVSNIEAGDIMTIGGTLGTVTLNGVGGTVEIRGTYKSIVDNRTGLPVLNLDGALNEAVLVKATWDRVISMANHNIGQSAGKILRQSGDLVQADGAVSDVSPSVGGFDTNLTDVDTYWEDAVLIFSNGAANAGLGKPVSTFLNTNGAMTFAPPDDWPVTPVNGDDFTIYATHVHPVSQIADAILAAGDVDGFSIEETLKLMLSALDGKSSGLDTPTAVYRAADDSKDRITATVDEFGNRSAVTLDAAG